MGHPRKGYGEGAIDMNLLKVTTKKGREIGGDD